MKKILASLVVIVLIGVGLYISKDNKNNPLLGVDARNTTYFLGGESVSLVDGIAENVIPNSVAKSVTRYFGNEVKADVNNDGDEDIVFLLTQENGGSGSFFYLAGAIKENGGYSGTNMMFIGDRIAPQTTEFRDGLVIVNYADRLPGDPMTKAPSIGKSLYVKYDKNKRTFSDAKGY